MIEAEDYSGVTALLRGYLMGNELSRVKLEEFLISDIFWNVIFDEFSDGLYSLESESVVHICLMLLSRRLKKFGCDELIANSLVEMLLPLSAVDVIRYPLVVVLADIAAQSTLDVSVFVANVLESTQSNLFFCVSFLIEVPHVVGNILSNNASTYEENESISLAVRRKKESLLSFHPNMLSFCLDILTAVPAMPVELQSESISCVTTWLVNDFIPPNALQETIYFGPSSFHLSHDDCTLNGGGCLNFIQTIIIYYLDNCSEQHDWCTMSETSLEKVVVLLETLFARFCEGKQSPESVRGDLQQGMSISRESLVEITVTVLTAMHSGFVTFQRILLRCPGSSISFTYLPDKFSFDFGEDCNEDFAVTIDCTPLPMRVMTRLISVIAKMLVHSLPNVFKSCGDGDAQSSAEEPAIAQNLLLCLVTASCQRDVLTATMALDACLDIQHRLLNKGNILWFYKLLMQAAFRHSSASYGEEYNEGFVDEWLSLRNDTLCDIFRGVYAQLGVEFLDFSFEIMRMYLNSASENSEAVTKSVVLGVLFSLYVCSKDITNKYIIKQASPDDGTAQYLANFLGKILVATDSRHSCDKNVVQQHMMLTTHQVFSEVDVIAAINQVLGSLSQCLCTGLIKYQLSLHDADFKVQDCFPRGSDAIQKVHVLDEFGMNCVEVRCAISGNCIIDI